MPVTVESQIAPIKIFLTKLLLKVAQYAPFLAQISAETACEMGSNFTALRGIEFSMGFARGLGEHTTMSLVGEITIFWALKFYSTF